MTNTNWFANSWRPFLAAVALSSVVLSSAAPARAAELIPSLGLSKSTDSNAGDAMGFGGLALRGSLAPFLKAELGVAYRQDSFSDDALKVRQWPVTASLWLLPVPNLYAGGGLGWYHTTYDFNQDLLPLLADKTTEKVGVHLGGGLTVPLTPQLGLDLNGRYIFMQADKDNIQFPTTFNPDFWNATLGLAIKF